MTIQNDIESKMKELEQEKYAEERRWQRAEKEIEKFREKADALYYQTGFRLLKDDPGAWIDALHSGIEHRSHSNKPIGSAQTFDSEDLDESPNDSIPSEETKDDEQLRQGSSYHNVLSEIRNVVSNYKKHDREALRRAMKRTEQLCKSLQNRCTELQKQIEILSNFKSNVRDAENSVHSLLEKTIKNPKQMQQWMDYFDESPLVDCLPNVSSGMRKVFNTLQVCTW